MAEADRESRPYKSLCRARAAEQQPAFIGGRPNRDGGREAQLLAYHSVAAAQARRWAPPSVITEILASVTGA